VMADRGEGLVMKAPDSAYVLNGRTNDWIKVCVLDQNIWDDIDSGLLSLRSSRSIW